MVLSVPKVSPPLPKKRGLSSLLPKKEGPQWPWFHTGRNLKEKRKMSPSDIYFFNKTEGKNWQNNPLDDLPGEAQYEKIQNTEWKHPEIQEKRKTQPSDIYIYIYIVHKTGEEIGKKTYLTTYQGG